MKWSISQRQGGFGKTGGWLSGLLVSLTLSSVFGGTAWTASPAAIPFPGSLTFQDGKLAARVTAAPLWQVMEEVGRLSGVQILWLNQKSEDPVSVEFSPLSLTEALQRLLGGRNFLLLYSSVAENSRLTQIWISSGGQDAEQPRRAQPLTVQGKRR
jgi:hypothetical protein